MTNNSDAEPEPVMIPSSIKKEQETEGLQLEDMQTIHATESVGTVNIFNQGGKNYRTLVRKDTILILFTNQIGLGVLSLPGVMKDIGIVPGIIADCRACLHTSVCLSLATEHRV